MQPSTQYSWEVFVLWCRRHLIPLFHPHASPWDEFPITRLTEERFLYSSLFIFEITLSNFKIQNRLPFDSPSKFIERRNRYSIGVIDNVTGHVKAKQYRHLRHLHAGGWRPMAKLDQFPLLPDYNRKCVLKATSSQTCIISSTQRKLFTLGKYVFSN